MVAFPEAHIWSQEARNGDLLCHLKQQFHVVYGETKSAYGLYLCIRDTDFTLKEKEKKEPLNCIKASTSYNAFDKYGQIWCQLWI